MTSSGSGASRGGGDGLHNEDAFLVEEGLGLYLVCDGASGTPAGEIASQVAAAAIEDFIERAEDEVDFAVEPVGRNVVARAMAWAMGAVADAEQSDERLKGLATTLTMLLAHRQLGVIGHRGDSRAYLVRDERAHQLTRDHDFTQAEGADDSARDDIEVFTLELEPGDTIILCTDGAEAVVQSPETVKRAGDLPPRLLASRLVSAAHRAAPGQDATVVVVRILRDEQRGWLAVSNEPRPTSFGHRIHSGAAAAGR